MNSDIVCIKIPTNWATACKNFSIKNAFRNYNSTRHWRSFAK